MAGLVVREVTKEFPSRGEPLKVLRGVSLELAPGHNVAILGPSGCGKSTLLHILGTLEEPTSGSVELDGENPFRLNERDLARFRNKRIGFVFQDHHLLPQLSVLENVLLPTLAGGRSSAELRERAESLLERVGLADRREHHPAEISGGERQRAAIARALIASPRLLLADEPTGNLDRSTAATVAEVLLQAPGPEELMLVVVTHSLALAGRLSRRLELNEGLLSEA